VVDDFLSKLGWTPENRSNSERLVQNSQQPLEGFQPDLKDPEWAIRSSTSQSVFDHRYSSAVSPMDHRPIISATSEALGIKMNYPGCDIVPHQV
jgi:hypothetical protein